MAGGVERDTALKKLHTLTTNRKCYFVRWYCTNEEEREDFEEYSKRFLNGVTIDTAMDYLLEEDVQKAIKYWMGVLHNEKMIKLYNTYYKKAIEGDVQAFKAFNEFSKDFLKEDKEDELSKILANVDLGDTND